VGQILKGKIVKFVLELSAKGRIHPCTSELAVLVIELSFLASVTSLDANAVHLPLFPSVTARVANHGRERQRSSSSATTKGRRKQWGAAGRSPKPPTRRAPDARRRPPRPVSGRARPRSPICYSSASVVHPRSRRRRGRFGRMGLYAHRRCAWGPAAFARAVGPLSRHPPPDHPFLTFKPAAAGPPLH
jgi:hypothetical protein